MTVHSRARLGAIGAAAIFSTGGAAIKMTTLTGVQVACARSGIAALAVHLLAPESRRGWSWRTWVASVAYAACLTLFVLANKLTTSANTIFLQAAAPLYLLLLGPWLLKERVKQADLIVLALMALGLLLVFRGTAPPVRTAPDPALGNVLALLSGVAWAFLVIGLRWLGRAESASGHEAPSATTAVVLGNILAALVNLPFALPVLSVTPADIFTILFLGVVQIAIAYLLLSRALKHLGALEASLLLMVEPALNPIWSWMIHGEVPGAWILLGGGLILGATVLKSVLDSRPELPVAT
ncbi:MAG TPA: EamA family transporter [Gemmatimonadales bacterium]|nr:EamA family transporter [Gemmatimonadales bacterium]